MSRASFGVSGHIWASLLVLVSPCQFWGIFMLINQGFNLIFVALFVSLQSFKLSLFQAKQEMEESADARLCLRFGLGVSK